MIVEPVGELETLEIDGHTGVGAAPLHHDFSQHAHALIDRGGHEQGELAEGE